MMETPAIRYVAPSDPATIRYAEPSDPATDMTKLQGSPPPGSNLNGQDGKVLKRNQTERFEYDFGKLLPSLNSNLLTKDKVVSLCSLTERTSMTGKVIETNFKRYAQEGHLLRSATASEISEIEFEGREDGISCSLCDVIGTQLT
ncbi:hypothetical protein L2E82_17072 [Cichorium intybus]|uniref:Uncharacterized protein n=1 Tax=Cichorium intybus TaxID=13427 RepID=A0ACB9F8J4_CICIN|nr:hypothetical protein L2E82_17072 [Cichorium intybus]